MTNPPVMHISFNDEFELERFKDNIDILTEQVLTHKKIDEQFLAGFLGSLSNLFRRIT